MYNFTPGNYDAAVDSSRKILLTEINANGTLIGRADLDSSFASKAYT